MSNAECPYCHADLRIDEPIGEDESTELECECGRTSEVTASVVITYYARCLPAEHKIKEVNILGSTYLECSRCGFFRSKPLRIEVPK